MRVQRWRKKHTGVGGREDKHMFSNMVLSVILAVNGRAPLSNFRILMVLKFSGTNSRHSMYAIDSMCQLVVVTIFRTIHVFSSFI